MCRTSALERLESAMRAEKMRELDRRTLMAFYFEGQSLKQMSDQFDSPIGTIKRRLHTARNRLKEMLTEMQSA